MSVVYRWFDHNGAVIEAPAAGARPTAWRWVDGRTHYLSGRPVPDGPPAFQAITLCGKRALQVPGREAVSCPECLAEAIYCGPWDQP